MVGSGQNNLASFPKVLRFCSLLSHVLTLVGFKSLTRVSHIDIHLITLKVQFCKIKVF